MRRKFSDQQELDFGSSPLKVTRKFYEVYTRIAEILSENSGIVEAVHVDLKKAFGGRKKGKPGKDCDFSTETVLRILIVKQIEDMNYRDTVVRIDDSTFLRDFVGLRNRAMMDFTTLCKMFKAIRSKTWKKVNDLLKKYAIETEQISGDRLRRDTTVFESNIHYPTDSSLLWDVYCVLARFITRVRDCAPELIGDRRLQTKEVKRIQYRIARRARKRGDQEKSLNEAYTGLLDHVKTILDWAKDVCDEIRHTRTEYTCDVDAYLGALVDKYEDYLGLGAKVVDQAHRRTQEGESVPNEEKIMSIFEPHVELIKRGKAGKPVEFGHVVNLQQVEEKFITGYDVFKKKPVEHTLVDPVLERHRKDFGRYPNEYADDRGAYESMDKLKELERKIAVVSIGKKGHLNDQEREREQAPAFKLAQKFRAGIEGSISYLKRTFGMALCVAKGWKRYAATVGSIVFGHNLMILARQ